MHELDPDMFVNVPTGQEEQSEEPACENVPGLHATHSLELVEYIFGLAEPAGPTFKKNEEKNMKMEMRMFHIYVNNI